MCPMPDPKTCLACGYTRPETSAVDDYCPSCGGREKRPDPTPHVITVTGCHDCGFYDFGWAMSCTHPNATANLPTRDGLAAAFKAEVPARGCPLLSAPVTVRLAPKAEVKP